MDEKSEFGENPISEWWVNQHFKGSDKNPEENLTFSPKDPAKEVVLDRADRFWRQRMDSNRAEVLLGIRDTMTSMADLLRHHRSLIWNADSGLLLWEIARKTPEGVTCGVCKTEEGMKILEQYGRTLGSLDRPILKSRGQSITTDFLTPKDFYNLIVQFQYNGAVFDRLFFTDPFATETAIIALAESLAGILTPQKDFFATEDDDGSEQDFTWECPLAEGWRVVISQRIPCHGQKISALVRHQILSPETVSGFAETLDKMEAAEQEFFGDRDNPLFNWDGIFIANSFRKQGLTVKVATQNLKEKRRVTPVEIEKWFNPKTSAYGAKMCEAVGSLELQKIVNLMLAACEKTIFEWNTEIAYFLISK